MVHRKSRLQGSATKQGRMMCFLHLYHTTCERVQSEMRGNKNAVYLVLIGQGANLRQLGHVQVLALELPLRQPR